MAYFINSISKFEDWEKVYHFFLEYCDSFIVYYPNGNDPRGDNPLLEGKKKFEQLPDIETKPWSGMADSSEFKGKLTEESKRLFKNYTEPRLWHFDLLKHNEKLFKVEDFTKCFIADKSNITEKLKATKKVDLSVVDNIEYHLN
ncbi:hypothetical protein ABES25_22975 [Bacillus gobiensis]|uniref:hypothetical protein n=1 Tax=Bacillus gobiensis TaxID=1441095 RepID=UPI003D214EF9